MVRARRERVARPLRAERVAARSSGACRGWAAKLTPRSPSSEREIKRDPELREREREGGREGERDRDRERERQTERERQRETDHA
jgi:hypothetical protein